MNHCEEGDNHYEDAPLAPRVLVADLVEGERDPLHALHVGRPLLREQVDVVGLRREGRLRAPPRRLVEGGAVARAALDRVALRPLAELLEARALAALAAVGHVHVHLLRRLAHEGARLAWLAGVLHEGIGLVAPPLMRRHARRDPLVHREGALSSLGRAVLRGDERQEGEHLPLRSPPSSDTFFDDDEFSLMHF